MSEIRDLILPFLDPQAHERVRTYFSGPRLYSGGRFELLGGGGDRPEIANTFTAEDIVAVSLLSVNIPGNAALAILEEHAEELNEHLSHLPVGVDLWAAPRQVVKPGSHADQLWQLLVEISDIGWVTAGKLMARKRPRLIPLYDRVVKSAINVEDWWLSLHDALQDESLRDRLEEIRSQAGLGDEISLLRVLDVAIWMTGGDPAAA